MNNDIRNLSKWLNEEQETPIDRQALARVLAMAEQPAQGCEFCSHPLYAGTKCKNCGREQPAPSQQCMEHGECFGGECIYPATQPPQRKPLRSERFVEIARAIAPRTVLGLQETIPVWIVKYGRAIEAAHGIKGDA